MKTTMKFYEVVYNTEKLRKVRYAFGAENMEAAQAKAGRLVSGEILGVFETDDCGNRIYNSTKEVANSLNIKYSDIEDFEALADSDKIITGGFYKMQYGTDSSTKYFFRDIFGEISKVYDTFNQLFDYLNIQVQSQLQRQKQADESRSKDEKPDYKYDYSSLIEKVKLNRVFHKKTDGRICSLLTFLTPEEVIAKNPVLQESDREILQAKEEEHYINEREDVIERFENGVLIVEYTREKPDAYREEREWNEHYQKTTGMPLPKGGLFK